ncbi:hypothetical protein AB9F29_20720, partial [Falsihalocynthiibacter sp. S25ZX9]|uniref:hypothetical protein n=1 Tax=Falsihalocynthiibacter sp. S25ZX9 TaxID=3240870 RepID=UPI00350FEE91
SMGSTIRDGAIQHWDGKVPSLSNGKWLKRALGAALKRDRSNPPFRALLLYNEAIAMLLIYLTVIEHYWGVLLAPTAALHTAVAVWMAINHRKNT